MTVGRELVQFLSYCLMMTNGKFIVFPFSINLKTVTVAIQGLLGSSRLSIDFCVDISGNYSLLLNIPNYSTNSSSTLEITGNEDQYLGMIGNISSEVVNFNMTDHLISIKAVFLFFALQTPKSSLPLAFDLSSGCLSLSRSPTSLLQQLYSMNFITKKILSFGETDLHVGEIHPEVDQERLMKCPLVSFKNQWGCQVTGIGFGYQPGNATAPQSFSFLFNTNTYLVGDFSTLTNDIILPHRYLTLFIESYFTPIFFHTKCKMKKKAATEYIVCKKNIIEQLPSISFIFGNEFGVELTNVKLFRKIPMKKAKKAFRIRFNKQIDKAIFGNGFIRNIHLVLNEEENYIGIASHESQAFQLASNYLIEKSNQVYDNQSPLSLIVLVILILSASSLFLLYIQIGKLSSFAKRDISKMVF